MMTPGAKITADDRGPAINVVAWVMMICSVFAALTKIMSNLVTIRKLSLDSTVVFVAMVMAIAQTLAVNEQVAGGLGRRLRLMNSADIDEFEKAGYATQILYIAVLFCAKLATLLFVFGLARTRISRKAIMGAMVFTGVWAVASIFTIAFQCPSPQTWAILSDKCINQRAMWDAIGVVDILTDFVVVFLPIFVLWDLQMPWSKKITVMGAFASRVLVIPIAILRLYYIGRVANSRDHPFEDLDTAMATQISMNLAIILTCFPFLKYFMDNVQHGLFTSNLRKAPGNHSENSYAMGSMNRYNRMVDPQKSTASSRSGWLKGKMVDPTTTTVVGGRDQSESRPSSVGSDQLIIKQTKAFTVETESIN